MISLESDGVIVTSQLPLHFSKLGFDLSVSRELHGELFKFSDSESLEFTIFCLFERTTVSLPLSEFSSLSLSSFSLVSLSVLSLRPTPLLVLGMFDKLSADI